MTKTIKAILIDSAAREVREVEIPAEKNLKQLQEAVGGYISTAWRSDADDVLFVDDEGLMKPQRHFFQWSGRSDGQPLAGNGILVGPERYDRKGDFIGQDDVTLTVAQVQAMVTFLGFDEFQQWTLDRARRPASTITMIGPDGRRTTEVLRTWGQMLADMPRPREDE